jgi:glycosyltransferase involved in cell wall biosynthesis
MRILVLIYEWPPIGGGGGQAAKDICQGLDTRGHDVRVITSHIKGLSRLEMEAGVRVIRVPTGRREPFIARFLDMSGFVVAGLWASLRIIQKWRPDIIHTHFGVPTGPIAWLLNRLSGLPYVLTAHLGDVPGGAPEKTRRWFRWVFPFTPSIWRNAGQVVAVSQYTRSLAEKHYPVDIQVIPNGVDLSKIDPGPITVNQPPRIAFAGRFMSQKNPLQLVRTLATLRDIAWDCVMLGDGPLRAEIETEIRKHELEKRFILPGWVSTDEVIDCFSQSDILFMPSLSEGLPVAGVQALAMGLAIVASRIGGFIDLVEPGENGYLIDPHHPEQYAEVLRTILSKPVSLQRHREMSRKKAHDFDIHTIVQSYEDLFSKILREG